MANDEDAADTGAVFSGHRPVLRQRRKGVDTVASVSPRALLWRSALAVAAVAAVFFMWECHSALVANRPLANAAAHNFHTEFNEGKYQEIFEQADYGFTYDKTETELAQALQAIRTKLGTANASELVGIRIDDTTSGRTF